MYKSFETRDAALAYIADHPGAAVIVWPYGLRADQRYVVFIPLELPKRER